MAEKKTKKTAKAKPAAEPKAKREKKAKEQDLMTFALRLPRPESEALHKAAGPRGASRTMRSLAAAFVAGDHDAFKSLIAEARKARQ
jgi:hypothetical protein